MEDSEARRLRPLHNIFVELFGRDHDAARVLAEQAGLDTSAIAYSPVTAIQLWNVLIEAHYQAGGAMARLVAQAQERKRERADDLQNALEQYEAGG